MLCEFKNIFGIPNEGFHKQRMFGLALWDIVGTIILILIISRYFAINIITTSICMIILFIFLHWLFCVDTALNKFLFGYNT